MKKPFLYASTAAIYIVLLVFIAQIAGNALKGKSNSILDPLTMLSLFVLSAAIMGYLFLSEPLYLLIENKRKEAILFFAKTLAFFACFVLIFTILLFVI